MSPIPNTHVDRDDDESVSDDDLGYRPFERLWTLTELEDQFPELQEPLIDGLLRRGEVATLVAPPKTGKSWLVQQLVFALAMGGQWLQFPTRRCRVLLIDCELQPQTLAERLRKVRQHLGLSPKELDEQLRVFAARDWPGNIIGLGEQLSGWAGSGWQPDVIIVDPQYALLPTDCDENSNGQMKQFYGHLKALTKHGAAVVTVHHMSKGNQTGKSVTDIGAGAGAQSRAADVWITLQQHNDPDILVFGSAIRSFKPIEPFCVRRVWTGEGVTFHVDLTADSTELARPRRRGIASSIAADKKKLDPLQVDDLVEMLRGKSPMKRDRLIAEVCTLANGRFVVTKRSVGNLIDDAIAARRLHNHQEKKGASQPQLWAVDPLTRSDSPVVSAAEFSTRTNPRA